MLLFLITEPSEVERDSKTSLAGSVLERVSFRAGVLCKHVRRSRHRGRNSEDFGFSWICEPPLLLGCSFLVILLH